MINLEQGDFKTNVKNPKTKGFKDINNCYIFLFASIIGSLNVLYSNNYAISMGVIALELSILAFNFVRRDITRYLGYYLIFLCLSLEFDILVGTEKFYGFKNFRVLGLNLGIITLLPVLVLAITRSIKINRIKKEYPQLYRFCTIVIFLSITGVIFGLLQILINDNNIQNIENILSIFIGASYSMMGIPLLMIVAFLYIVSWEREKLPLLEKFLIAVLIGVVVSMTVSLITGKFGSYGGVDTLLVTNIVRYIPFMLLFPFYKNYKSTILGKTIAILGIIGAILLLLYNASGKTIILYFLVPLGVLGIILKRKKALPIVLILVILPIILIFSVQAIEQLASTSVLFSSKFRQATAILKFWEDNWIQNMPASPRVRIVEFITIFYEYLTKPWFLIFGKGYIGTITDHTGLLTRDFSLGAYSIDQWQNGTFYRVHETLNLLFLYNGLCGLLFYFMMAKTVIVNYTKNPWILLGGFWFLMVYGFSVTMTAFGLAALLLGYIDLNKKQERM